LKVAARWYSPRLQQEVSVVRWGHWGKPVLLFPTAGGDAEEVERFDLVGSLGPLLDAGRVKVYSCDSIAGRAWLRGDGDAWYRARIQTAFDGFLYHEVMPAIRQDCSDHGITALAAGASIGAFNAVAVLCRHPDAFDAAVAMSGTYDLTKFMNGQVPQDFYFASPLYFLPNLGDGDQLRALRQRYVVLSTGSGAWEDPGESWRMAHVLGSRGIPNRVDDWGPDWPHEWGTWRAMLPRYLDELLP
jgi:esterase/lipase superfamily enzyme